jgi:uncharacterized lipoprotein YddW (UPF0748 family)
MILKKIVIFCAVSICVIPASCSREYIQHISVKRNFSGALWVVRHNISTPEKIDKLYNLINNTDIKHIFVQVRGRGDSYYHSEFEPPAFDVPRNFDPLKYLIEKTRKSDIKIHAWVNIFFVRNGSNNPPEENHILAKNPDWVTYDHSGRPMTDYSIKELDENLLEGYFLDPAIPAVRDYTVEIINDILNKYPVDGIHLDYIRYPYSGYNEYHKKYMSDFGYNPLSRKIFKKKYGIDPININRFNDTGYKRLFDKFREEQVSVTVKRIHNTIRSKGKNIILSAAVMPRYDIGKKVYFQDWPLWMKKNYIDMACIMSYTSDIHNFNNYIKYAGETDNNDRILMGIRVKEKTSLKKAREQIYASYQTGMRGYIIFSFQHNKSFINELDGLIDYERYIYKY